MWLSFQRKSSRSAGRNGHRSGTDPSLSESFVPLRSATVQGDSTQRVAENTDGGEYLPRSEEQLHVGTERVDAGRARLRKFVVTEQQTVT
jgi:hypothetical protein